MCTALYVVCCCPSVVVAQNVTLVTADCFQSPLHAMKDHCDVRGVSSNDSLHAAVAACALQNRLYLGGQQQQLSCCDHLAHRYSRLVRTGLQYKPVRRFVCLPMAMFNICSRRQWTHLKTHQLCNGNQHVLCTTNTAAFTCAGPQHSSMIAVYAACEFLTCQRLVLPVCWVICLAHQRPIVKGRMQLVAEALDLSTFVISEPDCHTGSMTANSSPQLLCRNYILQCCMPSTSAP
jgi:hypothetical protein